MTQINIKMISTPHEKRVAFIAGLIGKLIADEYDLNNYKLNILQEGAKRHDTGKIWIPNEILNKKEMLDDYEKGIMQKHPIYGAIILRYANIEREILPEIIRITYSHHEKWDGSGYPDGLAGEEIPLFARIVRIADSYDALRSKRPYKDHIDHNKTLEIINNEGCDPNIMSQFLRHIESKENIQSLDAHIFASYDKIIKNEPLFIKIKV